MRLLAVGDSFTYGEELADRMTAWPFLLGKKLGYEVTNLGKPSKSNTYITRQTIENAHEHDIIVIAWSHFARMEFSDEQGDYEIWPGCAGNLFQGELHYRKDLIQYFNRHHSDSYLYNQQLINIILLQNYLKQHNKRYIMLTAFNQSYGETSTRQLRILSSKINSQIDNTHYLGWPDESMMEWTYGTLKGNGGHFLEQGHEIVAGKIYEHIRHFKWIP